MTHFFFKHLISYCLIGLNIINLINCHFQPNLQQVYQQQQMHQQPQIPIQNQYQYQQPQQPQQQQQQQQYNPQYQQNVASQPVAHQANYQIPSNNILHDQARIHDKEHLKEHLGNVMNEPDLSKMSEEELQFYYFKIHDSDSNNKLDGSELIKSLIHWHVEESKQLGANASPVGTTKIFTDEELAQMIDPILESDDKNKDGFIDYVEFLTAQKTRGF